MALKKMISNLYLFIISNSSFHFRCLKRRCIFLNIFQMVQVDCGLLCTVPHGSLLANLNGFRLPFFENPLTLICLASTSTYSITNWTPFHFILFEFRLFSFVSFRFLDWLKNFVFHILTGSGAARLTQIFLPLVRRTSGRIVFVSSGMIETCLKFHRNEWWKCD